jgi:ABC-type polysaccharide/polyol phosphate export permease
MTTIAELRRHRELYNNLTLRELRGKYKRSALGWGWSLVNPVLQMGIYSLVFGYFLKVEPPVGDPSGLHVFAFFLLCGLLPWSFLANGLTAGMGSLLANANLVKKVWFPREILVAAAVSGFGVSLLIELGVLCVALLIAGNLVLPWLLPVLAVVVVQAAFVLGLSLTLSVCSVYFRDLEHLLGLALQFWFYATPIVYTVEIVEDALVDRPMLLDLYLLNPMTRFAEVYRDLLYHLRGPTLGTMLYLVAVSSVTLLIGLATFARLQGRLAEEL